MIGVPALAPAARDRIGRSAPLTGRPRRRVTLPTLLGAAIILGPLTLVPACAASGPKPLLRLRAGARDGATRLTLIAAAHYRINARLTPALELPDGRVLRFDGPRTADSAYFAEPPGASWVETGTPHGRLRASVCRDDESVCRSVALDL